MIDFTVTAPGGWNFFKQNIEKTLIDQLHQASDELAAMEELLTAAREPVRTGALESDVEGVPQHDNDNPELAEIHLLTEEQMDEYGRVYGNFVEGGTLGDSSPTISSPSEAFARIMTDDLGAIKMWGQQAMQDGLDRIANGNGVP